MKHVLFVMLSAALGMCAELKFTNAPGSPFKVPGGGHSFVAGDVNGDGTPDLLVSTTDKKLVAMLGDGRGSFAPASGSMVGLEHGCGEMVIADLNKDGSADWAGAGHDYYDVLVRLGDGKGGFRAAPGSPFIAREGSHPHTHSLLAGDMNGDGNIDLVTANNADNDVSMLLGDGRGGFTRAPDSPFAIGPSPYPMALGDVNGDGKLDVVAPNSKPGTETITVLVGNGKGGLSPAPKSPFRASGTTFYIALADVNDDSTTDIVATHSEDPRATILLGDGKGDFKPAPGSPLALGSNAWAAVPVDLDGDRSIDLVFGAGTGAAVFLNQGRGELKAVPGSPFRTGRGTWRVAVTDFNRDGKLDIAGSNVESDDISVLLQR